MSSPCCVLAPDPGQARPGETRLQLHERRPQAPVHVLIIPNKPIPTVNDVSDEDERTLGHMFIVARDIARAEGIADDGFRLIINCNQHGGQVVYHLHMHLLGGKSLGPMLSGGKHG